jgi:hypothetical protein
LHRAPPLTRIFAPGLRAPSNRTTGPFAPRRTAKMAVASPAAPAPTIAITVEGYSPRARTGPRWMLRIVKCCV